MVLRDEEEDNKSKSLMSRLFGFKEKKTPKTPKYIFEDTEKLQNSKASSSSGNNSSSTTLATEESSGSDQDAWSAVQEKALVQALKTFPKETAQRWERVATAVPGKTVNQCKKKFTSLKESFRNKKTTA